MENQIQEFFEKVTDEYSLMLLNWAYKKLGDKEQAEDLTQEVLVQVLSSIKKEISHGNKIEKLNNMVWKIAHYVWCHYLRRGINLKKSVPIYDLQLSDQTDFVMDYAESEANNQILLCLREKISRLNHLQREVMISFYIERSSIAQIADKLTISESAVKWHLFDTRKKLKKEITTMSYTDYVYRPRKLHMGINGQAVPTLDTFTIEASLTKQNICIACYRHAKTLDDLTNMLGIPKAYIEDDLKWLIEHEFIAEKDARYSTMFIIESTEDEQRKYAIYLRHKEKLSDLIVNELIASEDQIREIGFYGSHRPMNQLLWMLIYRFANYSSNPYITIEAPIRPDGGRYFPLGFDRSDIDSIDKVVDTSAWAYNGAMCNDNFWWFGLYNFGKSEIEDLIDEYTPEWRKLHELLCKVINSNFSILNLNHDDEYTLSKLVQKGFVSIEDMKVLPNFYVFTTEQQNQLDKNIFAPIAEKIKDAIAILTLDIEKCYKKIIPPHFKSQSELFINMALCDLGYLTTIFSFNDSKLYVPKDKEDGEFLTLLYIKP